MLKLKIEEINSFLNLEILNLDINILIKYFRFCIFIFYKKFSLSLANYFELHIIRDITRSNLIKLFKKL